jgi:two-component system, sensor histidine kinase and response regulator
MQKQTILCVDDEIDNVQALERIFRPKFNVLKATSGSQALDILDQHRGPVACIITDQRMPTMTGVEFLAKTIDKYPDTIRLLLTGYTDVESVISAVNNGHIYRYLTKPWDPVDLEATVTQAVDRFLLGRELAEKNIALEKALNELQTLDQAKNQFMILINHELKTPLTSIISFTDLISETPLSEEQSVCIQRIKKGADRLKNLIDDVLVVVGAETKTLKVKPVTFDAETLDLRSAPLAQQIMKQKNQSMNVKIQPAKLVGDPLLINQIFHRLIHNAVKFGNENSAIEVRSELVSPHKVRFFVKNEGSTIAQQVIDKILKPFFIDEDVMNHSVGMGLGLTFCQAILKAHGSRLNVENFANGVQVSFELQCL